MCKFENKEKITACGKGGRLGILEMTVGRIGAVLLLLLVAFQVPASQAESAGAAPQPVPSSRLQGVLDRIVTRHLDKGNKRLTSDQVHLAVIDLADRARPAVAHFNGDKGFYPSSVIKMIYMGYVYYKAGKGELSITPIVHRKLYQMIHPSSNLATSWIVDLWSDTSSGGLVSAEAYKEFAFKRNACNRWLRSLGIKDITACQKTWSSPIPPGEKQFLRDGRLSGGFTNRNSLTALAGARFLQLIAQDCLVDRVSCLAMRRLMIRDVKKQAYQRKRIAGGAPPGSTVYSKTGTTSDTFHDAGIVKLKGGDTFVLGVFITRRGYRGTFIRDVASDLCAHFLGQAH